jgi:hypothetical protein
MEKLAVGSEKNEKKRNVIYLLSRVGQIKQSSHISAFASMGAVSLERLFQKDRVFSLPENSHPLCVHSH